MEVKSQKRLAAEWLVITRKLFKEIIKRKNIIDTETLYNSFKGEIFAASGGDVQKINLAYEWYGKMVDMGVGKGVKLSSVKDLAEDRRLMGSAGVNKRRPRKWSGKLIMNEANQIRRLLGQNAKERAVFSIKTALDAKGKVLLKF